MLKNWKSRCKPWVWTVGFCVFFLLTLTWGSVGLMRLIRTSQVLINFQHQLSSIVFHLCAKCLLIQTSIKTACSWCAVRNSCPYFLFKHHSWNQSAFFFTIGPWENVNERGLSSNSFAFFEVSIRSSWNNKSYPTAAGLFFLKRHANVVTLLSV